MFIKISLIHINLTPLLNSTPTLLPHDIALGLMFNWVILILAYLLAELLERLAVFILRKIGFGPIGPIKGMRVAKSFEMDADDYFLKARSPPGFNPSFTGRRLQRNLSSLGCRESR